MKSWPLLAAAAAIARAQFCEHQWQGQFAKREDQPPHLEIQKRQTTTPPPPLEIKPLIVSGPSENRVDLIFFGDGYTEAEKDKFFDDAMALATELTDGRTFADVLPVMNWWAGFTASNESGIGVGGVPKDTVYGLYRDGTELRGVYYDKPDVARAACSSTTACDYPLLLGNDDLYGGLGGEFTVTTASCVNGAVILRHELGHSIIGVGEEYDGGEVYRGVNSAPNGDSVPWKSWYSSPEREPDVQRSNMPIQAYPWTLLNTTSAWSTSFPSAGTYDSYSLQFSISGVSATEDLMVTLDGEDVGWKYKEGVGLDRIIYRLPFRDAKLSGGMHNLTFELLNKELEGTAQLCNFEVLEYGTADEQFNFTIGHNSLYPTYDIRNQTTYRPTNDLCLMRDVYTSEFCDACIEGLWRALLTPLKLIDNVTQTPADPSTPGATKVELALLPLADLRKIPNNATESYVITWFGQDDAAVLDEWANKTTAVLGPEVGSFGVEVRFVSSQIRGDPQGVTRQKERYSVQK
ncbi:hypothetical protein MGG_02529 [Pyricularia oryzae 70-15]|uniref:IgA peptidase M64-domain-containing protein n=1 Tax=Pyricularia oryzae (strain 70-15 / ATCC MYA-4617 / FGSC 8958) TaxID=242507 RepID=G5EHJ1_PYRO7|nr:uncharacterized protein MGG_02529 [Pyricularia oryzae 70-15]EAQ70828.1 hypothetical protein MGCH7_ch7g235 [Pyricularia oryzae 70-15]EHA46537.1 hypothetical protein MGG_02529 [Pyricularia oryzae 70-15]